MEYLIEKGADINAVNMNGETAFSIAIKKSDIYSIEILITAIHNDKSISRKTMTEMLYEYYNYIENWGNSSYDNRIIDFLISNGADVRDKCMKEAFIQVISMRDYDLIEPLLKNGLNPNFKDRRVKNYTPLHYALSGVRHNESFPRGEHKIIPLLIEFGADVNAKDADGNTPLHIAVTRNRDTYDIQHLIKAGANVQAVNKEGKTPLHIAREKERIDCIEILKECISDS